MMNAKLYQAISKNYKDVLDEEDNGIIEKYFSYCRDQSVNMILEENLDFNNIYERFVSAYNTNCDNINTIESQINRAKLYIEESKDFKSKDDEIAYLRSKLVKVNKELDNMQESIDNFTDIHTVILDTSDALFGIYNLNMYAFDKSISHIKKSYDDCIESAEVVSFLEGYMKCNENTKSIIDRIDKLDISLTDTIRRN